MENETTIDPCEAIECDTDFLCNVCDCCEAGNFSNVYLTEDIVLDCSCCEYGV